jgi:hypothetical protein
MADATDGEEIVRDAGTMDAARADGKILNRLRGTYRKSCSELTLLLDKRAHLPLAVGRRPRRELPCHLLRRHGGGLAERVKSKVN